MLDDDLVARAMRITGAKSKREVVHVALGDLVRRHRVHRALRALKGALRWEGDLDSLRRPRV